MKWPLVSRLAYEWQERYIEFLHTAIEKLQKERDEQQERGDRAMDMLTMEKGYEPASPKYRAEIAAVREKEQEKSDDISKMLAMCDADLQADHAIDAGEEPN